MSTTQSIKKLKIAFIGNMNNNHFAIARYLRDEGYDCELLLFNDNFEHFHPKCDTYDLDYQGWVKQLSWGSERQLLNADRNSISVDLEPYDVLVGCGLAPAFLYKANRALDVMIPYGYDVMQAAHYRMAAPHYLARHLSSTYFQRKGLAKVKCVILCNSDDAIGKRCKLFLPKAEIWESVVPIVYDRQYSASATSVDTHWKHVFIKIRNENDLMVIAHGRHVWADIKNMSSKGNDILIDGWALFCDRNPEIRKKLVFMEYGQSVRDSKSHIAKRELESSICWLPSMYRKDLMPGLAMADIVAAEFIHSWIGGGVIYEALVAGKPLLMHSIEHADSTWKKNLYPIYNAKTPEEIAARLQEYVDYPERGRQMGVEGQQWYRENVVEKSISRYGRYFEERAAELGKIAR